jgi:mono/diheme cytochrome c family protein
VSAADARTDYILHCRGCHGPEGAGAPGAVPDFRDEVGRFLAVPGGREYLIRVPGTAQSELSDARVARLLNWLVREFSPRRVPRPFEPYTAAEVARHRRPPLTDVAATREKLLDAIAPAESRAGAARR